MPPDERDPSPDTDAQSPVEADATQTPVFCKRCGETSVPVANCCPWCNAWLVGDPPSVTPLYELDDEPEDDWHAELEEEAYPVQPTKPPIPPLVVVFVSYFLLLASLIFFAVLAVVAGVRSQEEMFGWMAVVSVLDALMTLVALALVWKTARQVLPHRTRGLSWLLAIPVLTALMVVNITYITYLRELFKPFGPAQPETIQVTLVTVLLICLQPAIFEELFFRQMMLGVFRKSMNVHVAVWLTAGLFAFAHLGNPLAMPYLFLAGAVFGYARVFGGLPLPMVLHFLHNFIVIAYEAWVRPG